MANKNELSQQSNKLNSQTSITEKDIAEVYRRMSRMYGHKFVSNFGAADDGTWLMALTGLQQSDLTRGLTALLSHADDWPPSLPRFKRMCLGITDKHIEAKAIQLARGIDSYNFDRLPEDKAYRRVKDRYNEAAEDLMEEYLQLAINGSLDEQLNKPLQLRHQDSEYQLRGMI